VVGEYASEEATDITTNMEANMSTFSMGGSATGLSGMVDTATENLAEAMAIAMLEVAKIKEEKKEKED